MDFSPSGPSILVATATMSNNLAITASNQLVAAIRFINGGEGAALVGVCSASASAGDLGNLTRLLTSCTLYIHTSNQLPYVFVTGGTTVYAQAGYLLKK